MTIFVFIIFIFVVLYFFPYILRYFKQWRLLRICTKNGYIVLTFDDGPGTIITPMLLEKLEQASVKATFFMLGNKVNGKEPIVKNVKAKGHEIGSHGYAHINAWKTNPWSAIKDINRGVFEIKKIDIQCELFRPPYGKINIFTWLYILAYKLRDCWWTDVSGDTYEPIPSARSFAEKVINRGGGVVLMHDHDRSKQRMKYVIEVTNNLIELAKVNGLTFKTYSEIL